VSERGSKGVKAMMKRLRVPPAWIIDQTKAPVQEPPSLYDQPSLPPGEMNDDGEGPDED
jgi:hypothetical protein